MELKGACTGITATSGDNSTKLATTAFVADAITNSSNGGYFGSIIGNSQPNNGVYAGRTNTDAAQVSLNGEYSHVDFCRLVVVL